MSLFLCAVLACASCGEQSNEVAPRTVKETIPVTDINVESAPTAAIMDPVLARGKRMFLRCKSCHTVDVHGRNGTGPNLHGIFGVKAGEKDGFSYSKAMTASEIVWDDAIMDAWIEKPNKVVPRTSMAFVGLKKAEDRQALIVYLKSVTD